MQTLLIAIFYLRRFQVLVGIEYVEDAVVADGVGRLLFVMIGV